MSAVPIAVSVILTQCKTFLNIGDVGWPSDSKYPSANGESVQIAKSHDQETGVHSKLSLPLQKNQDENEAKKKPAYHRNGDNSDTRAVCWSSHGRVAAPISCIINLLNLQMVYFELKIDQPKLARRLR